MPGYEFTAELYRGKSTIVLRAIRGTDALPVVIKTLDQRSATVGDAMRLHHEQSILADIPGDAVIRTLGLVTHNRTAALVLEDFGAVSFAAYLAANRLDIPTVLRLAIQLCNALEQTHSARVIHKDINPSNILIHPSTRQIKVSDFGISSRLRTEFIAGMNPSVLEGTLPYISPEQTGRMNRAVDYRTDFYSLGITLYEALLGWVPFQSSDPMELLHCHIAKNPAAPADVNPAIPRPVSDIVMKLLAKTAEDRYQSAAGLRADLEHCLVMLSSQGKITPFIVGRSDFSARFQIPQKLYGREEQEKALLQAFDQICTGTSAVLFVDGEAGIGKSALVHEVQKPIVRRRGFFVSGKFDQIKNSAPYAPLVQAIREFCETLLASSPAELDNWRRMISEALGVNGAVLSSVIPQIELILGEQPPVPELPPRESQNRFHSVVQSFVRAVATSAHPLVLFLDDLQWADQASLELMTQILADHQLGSFLLICALRPHEAASMHKLATWERALQDQGIQPVRITLSALDPEGVHALVADTLRLAREECQPLAALTRSKTAGNPFFVNEFLRALHRDGLLRFDAETQRWTWDLEEIRRRDLTENVVTMMTGNILRLPVATQESLQFAACLGNTFSLDTLAGVRGNDHATVAGELWPAIQEGLLIPLGDSYRFVGLGDATSVAADAGVIVHFSNVSYRFVHDRIQQAAYGMIRPENAAKMHYAIGVKLLAGMEQAGKQDILFAAVQHLNLGSSEIGSAVERQRLIRLNLQAGKRAKLSAAFEPALRYFTMGTSLATEEDRGAIADTLLALTMEQGECEYLTGAFAAAEKSFDSALSRAHTPADIGRVYSLKTELFIHQSKLERALATGLEALKTLGAPLPPDPSRITVLFEMLTVRRLLGRRSVDQLHRLPVMTNDAARASMNILMSLFGIAYSLSPLFSALVISRMMSLTLRHGIAETTPYAYGLYALLLRSGFGAMNTAHDLAQVSLRLSEQLENHLLRGRCKFVYGCLHNHWYAPLDTNREYLEQAYRDGMENGDFLYVSYALSQQSIVDLVSGTPLPTIFRNAGQHLAFVRDIRHTDIALYFETVQQWALALLGEDRETLDDGGAGFDASGYKERLDATTYAPPRMFAYYTQLQLSCFMRDTKGGIDIIQKAEPLSHALVGQLLEAEYLFYKTLTVLRELEADSTLPRGERHRKASSALRVFGRWAAFSPRNFAHKRDLLAAEVARVRGNSAHAMTLYDRAIRGAHEEGSLQLEGLANELAAEFHLAAERERVASAYLMEARACYASWGAQALVRGLEQRRGGLLQNLAVVSPGTRGAKNEKIPSTTKTASQTLDLISILKASQALSGEIVFPRLLERMMHILTENAGAQRGVLVLQKGNILTVEAKWEVGMNAPVVLQSLNLEEADGLSAAIVRYVARTRETVVLDDAATSGMFVADPYIAQARPKSLLCTPIEHQGKLTGILYLENNLSSHAFTPARLEVLRLLSAQVGVSIQNARLHEQEKELARIQEEFRLAAKIQQELLPGSPPELQGYEVFGKNIPAQSVGGDYFDFIRADDNHLAICIGDVSGKGLPASLLMANLQASLRGQTLTTLSPAACLERSNKLLYESTSADKFATVVYGILDTAAHRFSYSNGGHENPTLFRKSGGCQELAVGGVPLGMLESFAYQEAEVTLEPGDVLVMYSDGITEAMNPEHTLFGRDALLDLLAAKRDLPLTALVDEVVGAVQLHAAGAAQSDDITMVAVRRV